jgi:hypothetical protein
MAGAAGDVDLDVWEEDDDEISNLGLDEFGDTILESLPASPLFLRKDNPQSPEGSKHHMEEAEGDGVEGVKMETETEYE